MKKYLLIFTFLGLFMLGFTACDKKAEPETKDVPTMEEALEETQIDPNDFTVNPLQGAVVLMDHVVAGSTAPLTVDLAKKAANDGGLILFEANGEKYFVVYKADSKYAGKVLAEMAGKKIALYGMTKEAYGMKFFIMDKMEEVQ